MSASTHRHKRERVSALPRVAIIVSRYNGSITQRLQDSAVAEYLERGGRPGDLEVYEAPGAFELPALALAAARTGRFAGVLALGCVIRGETSHDRYISEAVANGLVGVTLATGLPVGFGVLTTENVEQAEARAGGAKGNKGQESMSALLMAMAGVKQVAAGTPAAAPTPRPDKAAVPGAKHRRRGDRAN